MWARGAVGDYAKRMRAPEPEISRVWVRLIIFLGELKARPEMCIRYVAESNVLLFCKGIQWPESDQSMALAGSRDPVRFPFFFGLVFFFLFWPWLFFFSRMLFFFFLTGLNPSGWGYLAPYNIRIILFFLQIVSILDTKAYM